MMLDAVYVDMQLGTIEGVKPKPEFLPLFNLAEPVRAGETVFSYCIARLSPVSTNSLDYFDAKKLIRCVVCVPGT